MSRVATPVSKLTRSIGAAARPSTDFAGPALLPKYAELLRNRRTPMDQADAHSRGMTTHHVPAPPQPNPINLPSPPQPSTSGRRTPVPILFNPQQNLGSHSGTGAPRAPEIHFVSQNQRNPADELAGIEHIDVDEAARTKAASSS